METKPPVTPPPPPINPTDRNVQYSTGMFSGHITLPSSFVTGCLILITAANLVIINWAFEQTNQVRARVREQEAILAMLIKERLEELPDPANEGIIQNYKRSR